MRCLRTTTRTFRQACIRAHNTLRPSRPANGPRHRRKPRTAPSPALQIWADVAVFFFTNKWTAWKFEPRMSCSMGTPAWWRYGGISPPQAAPPKVGGVPRPLITAAHIDRPLVTVGAAYRKVSPLKPPQVSNRMCMHIFTYAHIHARAKAHVCIHEVSPQGGRLCSAQKAPWALASSHTSVHAGLHVCACANCSIWLVSACA